MPVPVVVGLSAGRRDGQAQGRRFHGQGARRLLGPVRRRPRRPARSRFADTKLVKGGTVDIWVSRGPAHVTLIDLAGFTPAAAADWLAKNGLVGQAAERVVDDRRRKGKVYKQDPPAGTVVKRGDTVTYWVSKGAPQVTVPDLSGLTQSQASGAAAGRRAVRQLQPATQ